LRSEPPPQAIQATGRNIQNPHFWVLGDSFSRGNAWQSVIEQNHSIRSQTFHYDKIGCIRRWVAQASENASISTVILQVAQISAISRFSKLSDCTTAADKPIEVTDQAAPPSLHSRFQPSTDWRVKHSLLTQFNTWRMAISDKATHQDNQVANSLLTPHCALFSNAQKHRLLFQTGSLDHPRKTAVSYSQAATNLLALQRRVQAANKQFLVVVIPDKFSAYQGCIADTTLGGGTEAVSTCDFLTPHGIKCVNLMPAIQAQRLTTPDLYLPNDTHFSPAGYRLLADTVLPYLR
jgi:SGNH hydrolase-like domain, acetyltransferase AlgX